MARKTFKTAALRGRETFSINDTEFSFDPNVPGNVLMDFFSEVEGDDLAAMPRVINSLLSEVFSEDEKERFDAFTRDRVNNVSLEDISEIAGYIAEMASGNGQQPGQYGPG